MLLHSAVYEPFGPLKSASLGNGLSRSYGYDTAYRPTHRADGPYRADLTYDGAGNITAQTAGTGQSDYRYDPIDRLIQADSPDGHMAYRYDANGNRLSLEEAGQSTAYGYEAGSNRLAGIGPQPVTVDVNGNTTTLRGLSLSYTPDNRLAGAAGKATYRYNALGQRVAKRLADGTTEYFIYDSAGQLMARFDEAGRVTREYIYLQGKPLALWDPEGEGGRLSYVHTDHLGTPRAVTDATGATVWESNHTPFGQTVPNEDPDGDGNAFVFNLRFPGQYFDAETGLHYNYFRDYDPATGRYVESDPIGLKGGLNTYAYVANNPSNYTDPLGLYIEVLVSDSMLDRGSPFGHAAIDINGTVYSRHHSGWLVESRSAYLDRQQNIRDTVGLLLDTSWLEDDAVENYIQDRINGGSEYDLLSDSCSSNLSDALDEIGVTTTGPWQYGGISPADLLINLPKTGRVTNRYLYERRN